MDLIVIVLLQAYLGKFQNLKVAASPPP